MSETAHLEMEVLDKADALNRIGEIGQQLMTGLTERADRLLEHDPMVKGLANACNLTLRCGCRMVVQASLTILPPAT